MAAGGRSVARELTLERVNLEQARLDASEKRLAIAEDVGGEVSTANVGATRRGFDGGDGGGDGGARRGGRGDARGRLGGGPSALFLDDFDQTRVLSVGRGELELEVGDFVARGGDGGGAGLDLGVGAFEFGGLGVHLFHELVANFREFEHAVVDARGVGDAGFTHLFRL